MEYFNPIVGANQYLILLGPMTKYPSFKCNLRQNFDALTSPLSSNLFGLP
jgi:hypothetical protein